MPVEIDINRFQRSITEELKITKDRVRSLIGDANWAEEGRYKEAILRKVIRQYLPTNLEIGTGFIVSNRDYVFGREGLISNQLDLIIYDGKYPVVFKEGDFVILTESSVRGIIEVKSRICASLSTTKAESLNTIIHKFNNLCQFQSFKNPRHQRRFIGVLSYDYDGADNITTQNKIAQVLRNSNGLVNNIALGPNIFIKYWDQNRDVTPYLDFQDNCYNVYDLQSLSFSYFLSNLLHMTADEEPLDRYWFSFPIEGTKEVHRRTCVRLLNYFV